MKRIMPWILLASLFVSAFSACADKASENKPADKPAPAPPAFVPLFPGTAPGERAKNLIVRYNELLVFGYENLNMNYLQEVATHEQAEKAYFHMAAIGEGGVRMRARLNNIEWERIDQTKKDAIIVKTTERWDFAYHDLKSDRKTEEHKDFTYHMTYTIAPDKTGRWLISNIKAVSDEPAGKKMH